MSSWKPTYSHYTQQRVVTTFSKLIQYYKELGLTHIFHIILYLAIIEGVGYEVHMYITAGVLPYKECSKERPWTDKAEW